MQKCRHYQLCDWVLQHASHQYNETRDRALSFVSSMHFIDGADQVWHYGQLASWILCELFEGPESKDWLQYDSHIFQQGNSSIYQSVTPIFPYCFRQSDSSTTHRTWSEQPAGTSYCRCSSFPHCAKPHRNCWDRPHKSPSQTKRPHNSRTNQNCCSKSWTQSTITWPHSRFVFTTSMSPILSKSTGRYLTWFWNLREGRSPFTRTSITRFKIWIRSFRTMRSCWFSLMISSRMISGRG